MSFTVAIVSDTHVRVPYDDGQRAFPSDEGHNERNREAARHVQRLRPELLLHLGDVVHPIPTLDTHAPAVALAREIYGALGIPLQVVPGNHDVGDKPRATSNAPAQVAHGREVFETTWGPVPRSFDAGSVHFVVVDATVLGTGTDREAAQRSFVEQDLAPGHPRVVLMSHYPPFLVDPDEPEHYDDLALPGRRWLLSLCERFDVEALLCGHVHRVFLARHGRTRLWVMPSVAFVRPDYAELQNVPPEDRENGRDETVELGLARIVFHENGHRIDFVRPHLPHPGPAERPLKLGVRLRHRLGRRVEVPCGDLDELTHKVVRDDGPLARLFALSPGAVAVPFDDFAIPETVDRLLVLAERGIAVHGMAPGLPERRHADVLAELASGRHPWGALRPSWEVVLPDRLRGEALARALASFEGPAPLVSRVGRVASPDPRYFSHFPRVGASDEDLDLALPTGAAGLVLRAGQDAPLWELAERAAQWSEASGHRVAFHVELPIGAEAERLQDDAWAARRAVEAALVAEAFPAMAFFLDPLEDKDRGYHARNGLVDRLGRPRAAFLALQGLAPLLTGPPVPQDGRFVLGDAAVVLSLPAGARGIDLATTKVVTGPWPFPALLEVP